LRGAARRDGGDGIGARPRVASLGRLVRCLVFFFFFFFFFFWFFFVFFFFFFFFFFLLFFAFAFFFYKLTTLVWATATDCGPSQVNIPASPVLKLVLPMLTRGMASSPRDAEEIWPLFVRSCACAYDVDPRRVLPLARHLCSRLCATAGRRSTRRGRYFARELAQILSASEFKAVRSAMALSSLGSSLTLRGPRAAMPRAAPPRRTPCSRGTTTLVSWWPTTTMTAY
jgi:hypothetical protein